MWKTWREYHWCHPRQQQQTVRYSLPVCLLTTTSARWPRSEQHRLATDQNRNAIITLSGLRSITRWQWHVTMQFDTNGECVTLNAESIDLTALCFPRILICLAYHVLYNLLIPWPRAVDNFSNFRFELWITTMLFSQRRDRRKPDGEYPVMGPIREGQHQYLVDY